ncbi:hypothetical protein [Lysinibacillus sp. NPDC096259]
MLEGLDVLKDPIAVIGNFEQPSSIVLAASPVMKGKFKISRGKLKEPPSKKALLSFY